MSSQDLPPTGGYEPVQYKVNLRVATDPPTPTSCLVRLGSVPKLSTMRKYLLMRAIASAIFPLVVSAHHTIFSLLALS